MSPASGLGGQIWISCHWHDPAARIQDDFKVPARSETTSSLRPVEIRYFSQYLHSHTRHIPEFILQRVSQDHRQLNFQPGSPYGPWSKLLLKSRHHPYIVWFLNVLTVSLDQIENIGSNSWFVSAADLAGTTRASVSQSGAHAAFLSLSCCTQPSGRHPAPVDT